MNDLLLLAMMLDEPKYGYQMKREAGWILGQEALHNNLVYPMLRRFLDEGWVKRKTVPGERGQKRQQYALTLEGRRNLRERLSTFGESDAKSADAFHLRVGMLQMLTPASREAILGGRERYLQHRTQKLEKLHEQINLGKFGGEVVGHMRKQIEMELAWIRHLRRVASTIEDGGRS